MKLEHPPGVRSTFRATGPGKGGTWAPCTYRSDCATRSFSFTDGMNQLGQSEAMVLRSEIKQFLKLGERGMLELSPEPRPGTVSQMQRDDRVLELRFSSYESFDDDDGGTNETRHYRLYYSEPEAFAGELLLLLFASKTPGPIGLDEQNSHIDEAGNRLCSHGLLKSP